LHLIIYETQYNNLRTLTNVMILKHAHVSKLNIKTILTYWRSWALLEKLPIVQPLKNIPAIYETHRFVIGFTRALQWRLSWARLTQSTPSHPSLWDPFYYCPPTYVLDLLVVSFLLGPHQYPICTRKRKTISEMLKLRQKQISYTLFIIQDEWETSSIIHNKLNINIAFVCFGQ
jgi:hypothetical protein